MLHCVPNIPPVHFSQSPFDKILNTDIHTSNNCSMSDLNSKVFLSYNIDFGVAPHISHTTLASSIFYLPKAR